MAENRSIKSTLVSKNVTVLGRRTSVRLEPEMWGALHEISDREHCKIHDICSIIALRKNPNTSLTAAIRVFLMLYFRAAATEEGHKRAQHGDFMNMVKRARLPDSNTKSSPDKTNGDDESLSLPVVSKRASCAIEQAASSFQAA